MRGIRCNKQALIVVLGITPACAGNTGRSGGIGPIIWDHPRVCGEYKEDDIEIALDQGSPPRVRGIPVLPSR